MGILSSTVNGLFYYGFYFLQVILDFHRFPVGFTSEERHAMLAGK